MLYCREDSRHVQNIQINNVIGENEKCVFYFTEKKLNRCFGQPSTTSLHFSVFLSSSPYSKKSSREGFRLLSQPPFQHSSFNFDFLKRFYLFLERREERKKERERNIDRLPLTCPPTEDLLGRCPDREWNLQPVGVQRSAGQCQTH